MTIADPGNRLTGGADAEVLWSSSSSPSAGIYGVELARACPANQYGKIAVFESQGDIDVQR